MSIDNFVEALSKESNYTTTENGAVALKSTSSSLLDLFGQIGALRSRSETEIEDLFIKAFCEDKLLATKMAFYSRNVRGGLGEKRTFKIILKFMAIHYPEILRRNLSYISHFGRWDDLYELIGTPLEKNMWTIFKAQLHEDMVDSSFNRPISLLAKWLKSINTSSTESSNLGKLTAKKLGLSEKEYRKVLSRLRRYINVVERKMSEQEWTSINYQAVPSKAMANYNKAFIKHDAEGFKEYIEKVKSGTAKINASTLYPYDILEKMCPHGFDLDYIRHDEVIEELWKAQLNYIDGEKNVLIMADTSGSMSGRPMATSVGLAVYFAERNHGVFKNKFMTFSSKPSFVELKGNSLYERLRCIPAIVENTDLEKAFKLILKTAVNNSIPQEDMPKSLVVISDMQFDDCQSYYGEAMNMTWHENMKKVYEDMGYELPNIIYWNVDSRRDSFQVTTGMAGVQLASGQSPSTFKTIIKNIGCTPYEAMMNTLNSPEYDCITV